MRLLSLVPAYLVSEEHCPQRSTPPLPSNDQTTSKRFSVLRASDPELLMTRVLLLTFMQVSPGTEAVHAMQLFDCWDFFSSSCRIKRNLNILEYQIKSVYKFF